MDVEKIRFSYMPSSTLPSTQHTAAKNDAKYDKPDKAAVELDFSKPMISGKTRELTDKKLERIEKQNPNEQKREPEEINEEVISKVVQDANKLLKGSRRNLEYSIHEATKEIMVKVINSETGEVIREIPPEKALDIMAKIWELAGLFVDEKS